MSEHKFSRLSLLSPTAAYSRCLGKRPIRTTHSTHLIYSSVLASLMVKLRADRASKIVI